MFSTIYLRLKGKVPPPPPRNEKLGIYVKVTFWFRLIYPPPPPRKWNWTKHECYRKKIISSEVIKYILQSTPLPGPYLILCMHRKIVHFNFKWIFENLNFWFSDDSDIRVRWWKWKKGPLSHWKMKCSFLDYVQFLMIGWAIQVMNVNQNAKKGPPCHQKIKCSVLDYIQLLMISWVIWVMKVDWNVKKGPLCHQKMKCSFLYYVQLLMIGQVTKVDQNVK